MTYLARQGAGHAEETAMDALRAAVQHRRGLVADRKAASNDCKPTLRSLPVTDGGHGHPPRPTVV